MLYVLVVLLVVLVVVDYYTTVKPLVSKMLQEKPVEEPCDVEITIHLVEQFTFRYDFKKDGMMGAGIFYATTPDEWWSVWESFFEEIWEFTQNATIKDPE